MSVNFREGVIAPFGKCLFFSNDCCEAAVTLDVGPRIISFKGLGGENIMLNDTELKACSDHPSIKETYGKDVYHFFGGHRLWWTPERLPETYYPDEDPVACEINGNTVTLTPPPQPSGVQLVLSVTLDEKLPMLTIAQKVTNISDENRCHAAWGITQCRAGGIAVAPQNTRQCSPLPNRAMIHWPYNDMLDERFIPGAKYITLRQAPINHAFKYGFNNETGWCGYAIDGQLLYKTIAFDAQEKHYPDYGCNFESYTDANALEIESLSAERDLAPGESVTLDEVWRLLPLSCGKAMPAPGTPEFDAVIDEAVAEL